MTVFHRTLHIGNSARGKKTKQKVWCSKEQEKISIQLIKGKHRNTEKSLSVDYYIDLGMCYILRKFQ
jgi:hypothetical protein